MLNYLYMLYSRVLFKLLFFVSGKFENVSRLIDPVMYLSVFEIYHYRLKFESYITCLFGFIVDVGNKVMMTLV